MDHITNLYKNRAEALLEQINFLENKLALLNEASAPDRSFRVGDKSQAAWSELELENRARSIKKSGLFQTVKDEDQSQEWKDIQAELARRKGAKETPQKSEDSGVKTVAVQPGPSSRKVPGTEAPSGQVAKKPMQIPDSEKIEISAPKGPAPSAPRPQPMAQPSVSEKPTPKPITAPSAESKKTEEPWTMDPKLALVGIGGGLLLGKQITDRLAGRPRGGTESTVSAKPQEPAKPGTVKVQEPSKPAAPKTPEASKPSGGSKVLEPVVADGSYSTREGKIVTPKKTAPTVAERAALGRDLLRARMAQRTQEVPEPKYGQQKPAAEAKPNVPETQVKPGDMSTKGGQVVSKGSQVSSKVGKLMKGGAGVAGSIGAALGGEMAVEKGLEALGVENEHIKGVVAPTVGWAAGEGALTTALGLARGVGMGAALAAGGAAAVPAAIYGALAYPSYKAAEASQAAMEKEAERIKKAGSATRARFIGPKY